MSRDHRQIFSALVVALWCGGADATQRREPYVVFSAGIGIRSCATWLSSPASEAEGNAWVLGFWTGANNIGGLFGGNGETGNTTDAAGILASVKKRCLEDPAAQLGTAAGIVYRSFLDAGR